MLYIHWNKKGQKQYKALLTTDEPLPGLADNDLTRTIRKRGRTVETSQCRRGREAREEKKLKQQTLNLFLEDESTEEQEEHAGGSAAGSRQATSDEKISTGKGSQAASLPDQPGQNPAVELD